MNNRLKKLIKKFVNLEQEVCSDLLNNSGNKTKPIFIPSSISEQNSFISHIVATAASKYVNVRLASCGRDRGLKKNETGSEQSVYTIDL